MYTQAYPKLQQQKNVEIDKNVERSLSILQSNFNDVADGTAPSRGTQLKINEAELTVEETSYSMNYSFYRNGNYTNISITPDIFVYETQTGAQFFYLNGGIIHKDSDNGTMYFVEKPHDTRSRNGVLQVDLIGMNHKGTLLSGGTHTVVVTGGDGQVISREPAAGNSTINATFNMDTPSTQERDFWREYYQEKNQFMNCQNLNATAFSCETAPHREIIISYRFLTFEYVE